MSLVTLKEIASAAGTDTGTVSRVLSGDYRKARISELRAQEIRAVAERLKWRPNVAARSTRTGRFDSIAVVSSTILEFGQYLSPWFLNSVHDEAHRHNHLVNFVRLSPEQVEGVERAKILEEMSVDGWLLNFNSTLPESLSREIQTLRIPAILINNSASHDAVRPADFDAAYRMTTQLIRGGRSKVIYYDSECGTENVGRPGTHYSVVERQRGYEEAMRDAGLATTVLRPAQRVARADALGFAVTQTETIGRAEAVVTYNPFEAQVVLLLAERLGRRSPSDMLIAPFHESVVADGGLPIATAVVPWRELARVAVDMLMRKIQAPDELLPSEELCCELRFPAGLQPSL